ncbi:MAG: twitching motility protein PilT, partial [Flavobacterium sp.]|nr:twitching motility protein PilT [Flavobacterium sp.]
MKLYFDMNIYNRIFDDQNQLRIRFETMAVDVIFEIIEKKQHSLIWSFMLEDENKGNPYINRRNYINILSDLCAEIVEPNLQIKELAKNIMNETNAKAKDSLHIACAIYSKCECLLTCDDKLIKTVNANYNNIE